MNVFIRISLTAFLTIILGAACSSGGGDAAPEEPRREVKAGPDQLKLRAFQSCSSYRDFISEAITEELLTVNVNIFAPTPVPAAPISDVTTFGGVPDSVSTTNLIEAGVDEADLVKTDSDGNLYVAKGRYLVIADGFPPQSLDTLAELELVDEGIAQRLFVDRASGKAMVVVTYTLDPLGDQNPTGASPLIYPPPVTGTTLVFVDISNIADPQVTGRIWLERTGDERLIDGRVHLLSQKYFKYPTGIDNNDDLSAATQRYHQAVDANDAQAIERARAEVLTQVSAVVAVVPIDDFLPRARVADGTGQYAPLYLADCADLIRPQLNVRLGLATVLSFDLDGSNLGALTALVTAHNAYVSVKNFYIQQDSYNWWIHPDQAEQTAIHKIAIGADAPEYRAIGLVDGFAHGAFQYSEHEGYLRIFTHEQRLLRDNLWFPVRMNHFFVLEDDGAGSLTTASSIMDIAPDEQIFAARFLGDRGFLVTFRQIDPLFAFDLSDPYAPVMTGELEIPGFSTYIHPLGDNHLLTIGRVGTGPGAAENLQLQIFDVSDMSQPMLIHSFIPEFDGVEPGWVWSVANHEHKAFTYFEENGILSFPVTYEGLGRGFQFAGFLVFKVDALNGFEELGRIDHDDLADEAYCAPFIDTGEPLPFYCTDPDYRLLVSPLRTAIMTEGESAYIYSVSTVGIKATSATDANNVLGSILLPLNDPIYHLAIP